METNHTLRAVRVTYSDGSVIATNMAAHLTDKEMSDYFKVGKWFNIGAVTDNMQQVTNFEILK